ncbi:uncharacterized mitochondrial protein AtMg00810-like [Rhagoletis pomonella]|uniref:uncharacterized mitochondrial protein AtMg00810-like n=1 Tax=Rhagoletis pomonella TaxID=28610 RepID=UPI0017874019|nr:uncharacterized mitochondrial protein AtMg00810-like [Rhagoletis pomonella]
MLERRGMQQCRPAATPLDAGFTVGCKSSTCKRVDAVEYQSMIGELMYLAVCTRPDIMHSVCKLTQRNSDPHIEHEAGIKHILRYLAATKDLRLYYSAFGKSVEGFADADWGQRFD